MEISRAKSYNSARNGILNLTAELAALRLLTPVKLGLTLLLLVTLLSQALFALVGRHLVAFALLTTWHCALLYLF